MTNAILYLGFKNPILVEHQDLIIYRVLLAQILYSFRSSEPWTAQFARRSVSPELNGREPDLLVVAEECG